MVIISNAVVLSKFNIHLSDAAGSEKIHYFRVPLDYFNNTAGTAVLSLARYPATNRTARLGTLLTNPGGPGGSGVNYIYRAGKRLSDILEGRYDIVCILIYESGVLITLL